MGYYSYHHSYCCSINSIYSYIIKLSVYNIYIYIITSFYCYNSYIRYASYILFVYDSWMLLL